jgi:polyhydroxybutyrate depolymerase
MMLRLLVAAAAVALVSSYALVGCGSSGSTTAEVPAGANPDDAATSPRDGGAPAAEASPGFDAAPPPTLAACSGKSTPKKADDTWTVAFGSDTRSFDLHVPATYDPAVPMPVVLNFHGYTSNAPEEEALSDMNGKADTAGFIVVYPQGTGTAQSWNAGACCGEAVQQNKDDVGLVGAILDVLQDRLCIDAKRVFATGMSNGGFMSHRLACEMSTRIAAVAPVAGVLGIPACNPTRPVPIIHFHGTLDPLVPYGGSLALGFPSVPDTFAGWAKREACVGDPVETYRKNDAHCSTYRGCTSGSEVTLCTVDGGGHTWPGGLPVPVLGYTSPNLSATDAMWDFFVKHPLL